MKSCHCGPQDDVSWDRILPHILPHSFTHLPDTSTTSRSFCCRLDNNATRLCRPTTPAVSLLALLPNQLQATPLCCLLPPTLYDRHLAATRRVCQRRTSLHSCIRSKRPHRHLEAIPPASEAQPVRLHARFKRSAHADSSLKRFWRLDGLRVEAIRGMQQQQSRKRYYKTFCFCMKREICAI